MQAVYNNAPQRPISGQFPKEAPANEETKGTDHESGRTSQLKRRSIPPNQSDNRANEQAEWARMEAHLATAQSYKEQYDTLMRRTYRAWDQLLQTPHHDPESYVGQMIGEAHKMVALIERHRAEGVAEVSYRFEPLVRGDAATVLEVAKDVIRIGERKEENTLWRSHQHYIIEAAVARQNAESARRAQGINPPAQPVDTTSGVSLEGSGEKKYYRLKVLTYRGTTPIYELSDSKESLEDIHKWYLAHHEKPLHERNGRVRHGRLPHTQIVCAVDAQGNDIPLDLLGGIQKYKITFVTRSGNSIQSDIEAPKWLAEAKGINSYDSDNHKVIFDKPDYVWIEKPPSEYTAQDTAAKLAGRIPIKPQFAYQTYDVVTNEVNSIKVDPSSIRETSNVVGWKRITGQNADIPPEQPVRIRETDASDPDRVKLYYQKYYRSSFINNKWYKKEDVIALYRQMMRKGATEERSLFHDGQEFNYVQLDTIEYQLYGSHGGGSKTAITSLLGHDIYEVKYIDFSGNLPPRERKVQICLPNLAVEENGIVNVGYASDDFSRHKVLFGNPKIIVNNGLPNDYQFVSYDTSHIRPLLSENRRLNFMNRNVIRWHSNEVTGRGDREVPVPSERVISTPKLSPTQSHILARVISREIGNLHEFRTRRIGIIGAIKRMARDNNVTGQDDIRRYVEGKIELAAKKLAEISRKPGATRMYNLGEFGLGNHLSAQEAQRQLSMLVEPAHYENEIQRLRQLIDKIIPGVEVNLSIDHGRRVVEALRLTEQDLIKQARVRHEEGTRAETRVSSWKWLFEKMTMSPVEAVGLEFKAKDYKEEVKNIQEQLKDTQELSLLLEEKFGLSAAVPVGEKPDSSARGRWYILVESEERGSDGGQKQQALDNLLVKHPEADAYKLTYRKNQDQEWIWAKYDAKTKSWLPQSQPPSAEHLDKIELIAHGVEGKVEGIEKFPDGLEQFLGKCNKVARLNLQVCSISVEYGQTLFEKFGSRITSISGPVYPVSISGEGGEGSSTQVLLPPGHRIYEVKGELRHGVPDGRWLIEADALSPGKAKVTRYRTAKQSGDSGVVPRNSQHAGPFGIRVGGAHPGRQLSASEILDGIEIRETTAENLQAELGDSGVKAYEEAEFLQKRERSLTELNSLIDRYKTIDSIALRHAGKANNKHWVLVPETIREQNGVVVVKIRNLETKEEETLRFTDIENQKLLKVFSADYEKSLGKVNEFAKQFFNVDANGAVFVKPEQLSKFRKYFSGGPIRNFSLKAAGGFFAAMAWGELLKGEDLSKLPLGMQISFYSNLIDASVGVLQDGVQFFQSPIWAGNSFSTRLNNLSQKLKVGGYVIRGVNLVLTVAGIVGDSITLATSENKSERVQAGISIGGSVLSFGAAAAGAPGIGLLIGLGVAVVNKFVGRALNPPDDQTKATLDRFVDWEKTLRKAGHESLEEEKDTMVFYSDAPIKEINFETGTITLGSHNARWEKKINQHMTEPNPNRPGARYEFRDRLSIAEHHEIKDKRKIRVLPLENNKYWVEFDLERDFLDGNFQATPEQANVWCRYWYQHTGHGNHEQFPNQLHIPPRALRLVGKESWPLRMKMDQTGVYVIAKEAKEITYDFTTSAKGGEAFIHNVNSQVSVSLADPPDVKQGTNITIYVSDKTLYEADSVSISQRDGSKYIVLKDKSGNTQEIDVSGVRASSFSLAGGFPESGKGYNVWKVTPSTNEVLRQRIVCQNVDKATAKNLIEELGITDKADASMRVDWVSHEGKLTTTYVGLPPRQILGGENILPPGTKRIVGKTEDAFFLHSRTNTLYWMQDYPAIQKASVILPFSNRAKIRNLNQTSNGITFEYHILGLEKPISLAYQWKEGEEVPLLEEVKGLSHDQLQRFRPLTLQQAEQSLQNLRVPSDGDHMVKFFIPGYGKAQIKTQGGRIIEKKFDLTFHFIEALEELFREPAVVHTVVSIAPPMTGDNVVHRAPDRPKPAQRNSIKIPAELKLYGSSREAQSVGFLMNTENGQKRQIPNGLSSSSPSPSTPSIIGLDRFLDGTQMVTSDTPDQFFFHAESGSLYWMNGTQEKVRITLPYQKGKITRLEQSQEQIVFDYQMIFAGSQPTTLTFEAKINGKAVLESISDISWEEYRKLKLQRSLVPFTKEWLKVSGTRQTGEKFSYYFHPTTGEEISIEDKNYELISEMQGAQTTEKGLLFFNSQTKSLLFSKKNADGTRTPVSVSNVHKLIKAEKKIYYHVPDGKSIRSWDPFTNQFQDWPVYENPIVGDDGNPSVEGRPAYRYDYEVVLMENNEMEGWQEVIWFLSGGNLDNWEEILWLLDVFLPKDEGNLRQRNAGKNALTNSKNPYPRRALVAV